VDEPELSSTLLHSDLFLWKSELAWKWHNNDKYDNCPWDTLSLKM